MRFSVWPSNQQAFEDVLAVCHHAVETGWHGVWVADHLMPSAEPLDRPVVECWTTLAALAARLPRGRIGTLVTGNTFRHPGLLAKMAATVDEISGGRLVVGLGAGWQAREHRSYGLDLPEPAERLERLSEACRIVKRLWSEPQVTFEGEHYVLRDATLAPRPRRGSIPLLLGVKGEQRGLAVAAEHADEWNVWADPEILAHKSDVLARHCARLGRDPAAIRRSAQALLYPGEERWTSRNGRALTRFLPSIGGSVQELQDTLGAYADAGLDELVVSDLTFAEPRATLEVLDWFLAEVAAPFRHP